MINILKKFALTCFLVLFAINVNAQDLKNNATNKITSELNKCMVNIIIKMQLKVMLVVQQIQLA